MRIAYEDWNPKDDTLDVVEAAVQICADYARQGYDLTLRQCYYQFVARGLIVNTERSYKRLGGILNKARMAGLLDWDYIVDRTRNLEEMPHWDGPADVLRSAAAGFNLDLWVDQPTRVEVWVEKEALAGVVERVARRWDCAYFSCRGYVSQSEQWAAAQRIRGHLALGQKVVVVHLGDHDPSGIDMTRDITDRLTRFIETDWADERGLDPDDTDYVWNDIDAVCEGHEHRYEADWWHPLPFAVRRIALNMDQVQQYNPPPNPAKITDSRAAAYITEFGRQSWELDALDPATLDALINRTIAEYVDEDLLDAQREDQATHRGHLTQVAGRWAEVVEGIE